MIPLRDNIRSKNWPFITYLLIAANAYVFYLQLSFHSAEALDRFIREWAVTPHALWANPISNFITLLTATFLHGGWLHIISNMLYLFIFGDNVEDRMGPTKYILFYTLMAILANGTQAYISSNSQIPLLGASGAVAGVLGAYFYYFPHAKVLTLFPFFIFSRIIEIPAFFLLGFWFILQLWNGVQSHSYLMSLKKDIGGVAWWAHAGGFIAGMIMAPFFGGKKTEYK